MATRSANHHVVLVSRDVAPFGHGGIAVYVTALARVLSAVADVTVVTSDTYEESAAGCKRGHGPSEFPPGVELRFVPEPIGECAVTPYRRAHEWSVRVWETVRALCRERQVDLIEFPDWGGEGCVTLQARRTHDKALSNSIVCVRAHSTVEMNAALNGHVSNEIEALRMFDLERYSLRYADTLLWAGGDILGSYERFYGRETLAQARRIRHPAPAGTADVRAALCNRGDGPLRLLYLGRLERRKGLERLLRAMREVENDELELTIVGDDTDTGPLGVSMHELSAMQVAGDGRISFLSGRARGEILQLIEEHDLGVLPSVWECWPNVVLEFLALNTPVLATPTGGPLEMVEPGICGWLSADASVPALAREIEVLAAAPSEVDGVAVSRGPERQFAALANSAQILEKYEELLASRERPRRVARSSRPLASVVVTYFDLADHVEDTVASLVAQTHKPLELIVVNDGSFEPDDLVLDRLTQAPYEVTLVTQENAGTAAVRNFGICQSQGRYFLPFDADNILDESFVSRCVNVLESDPSVAYVTSWERIIDEHGEPAYPHDWLWHHRFVSNSCPSVFVENIAGDAPAVFRRSLFDAGFVYDSTLAAYEDWNLYQRLANAGHYGHAIPEPLILYRVRSDSMLRRVAMPYDDRLRGEMRASHLGVSSGWAAPL